MTVLDNPTMGHAYSNAQLTPPISMSNFDTRQPTSIKQCDVLNGSYFRLSANNVIRLHTPALSNGYVLSSNETITTGTSFPGASAAALISTDIPYITYNLSNGAFSNARFICPPSNNTSIANGFGVWTDAPSPLSSGFALTITCTPPNAQSYLFQIKGRLTNNVIRADAAIMCAHTFFVRNMDDVTSGWHSPNFNITPNQRTRLTFVFEPGNISTYQDGTLRSNISVPGFTMSMKHYASLIGSQQVTLGAYNNSNMSIYEYLIHDYPLSSTQVNLLHNAISKLYLWT
jgi:hypothetical protein